MTFGRPSINPFKIMWGLIFILLGIGSFYLCLYQANQAIHNEILRFTVPGTYTAEIKEPGTYTIYHEFKSKHRGKTYFTPGMPRMKITAEEKITHEPIKLVKVENPATYNIADSSGQELYRFEADKAKLVKIDVEWADGSPEPVMVFSVTGDFAAKIADAFSRGILFLVLFIVAGLGTIIVHVGQVNALNREFQEIIDSTPPPPVFSHQAPDPVERLTDED